MNAGEMRKDDVGEMRKDDVREMRKDDVGEMRVAAVAMRSGCFEEEKKTVGDGCKACLEKSFDSGGMPRGCCEPQRAPAPCLGSLQYVRQAVLICAGDEQADGLGVAAVCRDVQRGGAVGIGLGQRRGAAGTRGASGEDMHSV